MELARELGIAEYLHERLVIQGYINAIKALWELKQVVKPGGVSDRVAAGKWFQSYVDSLSQARDNLPLWENALPNRSRRRQATEEVSQAGGRDDRRHEGNRRQLRNNVQ